MKTQFQDISETQKKITIEIPHFQPMDDVTIAQ